MSAPLVAGFTPRQAWEPLPEREWSPAHAAHLLRRMGFAADPHEVAAATEAGPIGTTAKAFAEAPSPLPLRGKLNDHLALRDELVAMGRPDDQQERQQRLAMFRRSARDALQDYAVTWFRQAARPQHAAQEKLVLFLQDVLVVAYSKVRDTELLFDHQELLRSHCLGPYPELVKAATRSPAMVLYLDLNRSTRQNPNENFARELFELFTLGEGNYTEQDIKEAARAFTGYIFDPFNGFRYNHWGVDKDAKTVFGETGNWTGDDIVDLAFRQPAASTFLPREFLNFYLSHDPLPEAYLKPLGQQWRAADYQLRALVEIVFTSRLFYAPEFRGQRIKSPVEFYLGLCHDLRLAPSPLPAPLLRALRTMGQPFYDPPNVRGWVYGPNWINSTTLAARRASVDALLTEVDEERMNADDRQRLVEAREQGWGDFTVRRERLESLANWSNQAIAEHFCNYFIAGDTPQGYVQQLSAFLDHAQGDRIQNILTALSSLLKSPAYQLV